MTVYGVQSTGYVRKPLSVILAEIEAAMITEFGPGVIQTAQSPFGQLNGLMADLVAEMEELNLGIYQAYDPDQAEGTRLDTLARVRQLERNNLTDAQLRQLITNEGLARVDTADIRGAVFSVDGVTFAAVYSNDGTSVDTNGMDPGSVCVAVIGGADEEVAYMVRTFMPPGAILYGNSIVNTSRDGYCRAIPILRPVVVPVNLTVYLRQSKAATGCPPPDSTVVGDAFLEDWEANNFNGKDVSYHNVRQLIESRWANMELIEMVAIRDGIISSVASIGFVEISDISSVVVGIVPGISGEIEGIGT